MLPITTSKQNSFLLDDARKSLKNVRGTQDILYTFHIHYIFCLLAWPVKSACDSVILTACSLTPSRRLRQRSHQEYRGDHRTSG